MSLKEAILASVGGNVIDLATPSEFDLVEEFKYISYIICNIRWRGVFKRAREC